MTIKKYIHPLCQNIYHIDFDGNIIGEYDSQLEASKITNIDQGIISKSIKKKRCLSKYEYSFFIDKKDLLTYNIDEYRNNIKYFNYFGKVKSKKIHQFTLDNVHIRTYHSMEDLLYFLKLDKDVVSHIHKVIMKKRKSAYGYRWSDNSHIRKLTRKKILYYIKNELKSVFDSRKDVIKSLNITKGQLSLILSGKYTPKKYNFVEVSYEFGIKKQKEILN